MLVPVLGLRTWLFVGASIAVNDYQAIVACELLTLPTSKAVARSTPTATWHSDYNIN